MNTELPADQRKRTTEQLIQECAGQGVTVTATQLARWVREGLIPDSLRHQHGLGRGSGTEWLWEAECVSRAVIIGRSLRANRSLPRASRVLAEAGYVPAPAALRQVLLGCLEDYRRLMTTRQTYIDADYSQEEQYKRFRRHLRQRAPDMPDVTFDPFLAYVAALLRLLPSTAAGSEHLWRVQHILSIPSVKESLEAIDDAALLAAYTRAGCMMPTFIPFLVRLYDELLVPFAKNRLEKEGQEATTFPHLEVQKLREDVRMEDGRIITSNLGLGRLRLYMTILLAVLPPGEEQDLEQWSTALLDILDKLLVYFGFSSSFFTQLLANSKDTSAPN